MAPRDRRARRCHGRRRLSKPSTPARQRSVRNANPARRPGTQVLIRRGRQHAAQHAAPARKRSPRQHAARHAAFGTQTPLSTQRSERSRLYYVGTNLTTSIGRYWDILAEIKDQRQHAASTRNAAQHAARSELARSELARASRAHSTHELGMLRCRPLRVKVADG